MIKACGQARFSADYKIKGALELAVVRSPLPHAKIVSIDASAAEKMPGVAGVMTAADVKGTNILKYLVADPSGLVQGQGALYRRSHRGGGRPDP